MSLLYIVLAGLGLSFLVFIHELGHYIVARKAGIRVEVFSIGFGKPLIVWKHKGVKWQICWLLFGGFVKIAGMEKENGKEPHEVKDGFYGKSPLARIEVALAGPVVNIVFAFLVFTVIWLSGGRLKPFEEYTHIIGWIDPKSELASQGVRPGDTIINYNGHPFNGFKDLIYTGVLKSNHVQIVGEKINYLTDQKTPYDYNLVPYYKPGMYKDIKTIGILQPASFLIFGGFDEVSREASPVYGSGIEPGDRVIWANGDLVFSTSQLNYLVNQESVFVTVERGGERFSMRVPRIPVREIQLSVSEKDEFIDWRRELGLTPPLKELFFLTHAVDEFGHVGHPFAFIDPEVVESEIASVYQKTDPLKRLQTGDRIIAVFGSPVASGLDVFKEVTQKKVLLIAQKEKESLPMTWKNQDEQFVKSIDYGRLKEVIASIGVIGKEKTEGEMRLLRPVTPVTYNEFQKALSKESTIFPKVVNLSKEQESTKYIFVGSFLRDRLVEYNPGPMTLFNDVLIETWKTFSSLIKGNLSPKWLSGPVGIVKVMHDGWSMGIKEALYWIALISMNLGILNLLPIPVLDGGHISFALFEMITKKRLSAKTMERLVLPFVVLLIMFFVYVTYQDVSRLLFK